MPTSSIGASLLDRDGGQGVLHGGGLFARHSHIHCLRPRHSIHVHVLDFSVQEERHLASHEFNIPPTVIGRASGSVGYLGRNLSTTLPSIRRSRTPHFVWSTGVIRQPYETTRQETVMCRQWR
ncbi:hypothetical protein U9M48_023162 [Paspalum notatum var. saurae]|uniref:Uncharacterized protein n=1 Tax=Paspalum notatum var. saurae TaxID=547442 RepID=A0AAQ3WVJ2_PASNO